MTDINTIFTAIGAIGTVGGALVCYWTLRELKEQKENVYKPHLFLESGYFNVKSVMKGDYLIPCVWSDNSNLDVLDFNQDNNTHIYNLKCYNIGFGSAKNVVFDYEIDVDAFIKIIKQLEEFVDAKLLISIEPGPIFIRFRAPNRELLYPTRSLSRNYFKNGSVPYILPIGINREYTRIYMPAVYMELMNVLFYYISYAEDDSVRHRLEEFLPKIYLKITYQDINNKFESKTYNIETNILSFGTGGYSGEFIVKEKRLKYN